MSVSAPRLTRRTAADTTLDADADADADAEAAWEEREREIDAQLKQREEARRRLDAELRALEEQEVAARRAEERGVDLDASAAMDDDAGNVEEEDYYKITDEDVTAAAEWAAEQEQQAQAQFSEEDDAEIFALIRHSVEVSQLNTIDIDGLWDLFESQAYEEVSTPRLGRSPTLLLRTLAPSSTAQCELAPHT